MHMTTKTYIHTQIYVYSEKVIDECYILHIWTRDSSIWRVNEPYGVETSEYIWYVIVTHNAFQILNVTLK